MCPGATELTRTPRGPSSVARRLRHRQQRRLGHLVRPHRALGEPHHHGVDHHDRAAGSPSSAGVNSRVSRSAATTLASKPGPRASRLDHAEVLDRRHRQRVVHQRVDPAERVLRRGRPGAPPPRRRRRRSAPPAARRPSPATSLATSSSRAAVRAASTTSAPSRALASATDRPSPDPTPATTTTLSSQHHQPSILSADGGLARGDPRPPLLRGHPRLLVVRQPFGSSVERRPPRPAARRPRSRSRVSRCQRICT